MEIWKDIKGYEGLYQVSSEGRVRSLDRLVYGKNSSIRYIKGAIICGGKQNCGYLIITLSKNRKSHTFLIHRLVAEAFIPNPSNLPEVNHIDEDKTNNRVENLEYCDRTYNLLHGTRIERFKKAKSRPILQFSEGRYLIGEYDSIKEAGQKLGIDTSHITKCCKGKIKSAGGYIWRYKEREVV